MGQETPPLFGAQVHGGPRDYTGVSLINHEVRYKYHAPLTLVHSAQKMGTQMLFSYL